MAFPNLPTAVPIAIAAGIAGLSRGTFCERLIATGTITLDADHRVPLAALARYLGRPIDIEAYLSANRKRDKARAAQRSYRRRAA